MTTTRQTGVLALETADMFTMLAGLEEVGRGDSPAAKALREGAVFRAQALGKMFPELTAAPPKASKKKPSAPPKASSKATTAPGS